MVKIKTTAFSPPPPLTHSPAPLPPTSTKQTNGTVCPSAPSEPPGRNGSPSRLPARTRRSSGSRLKAMHISLRAPKRGFEHTRPSYASAQLPASHRARSPTSTTSSSHHFTSFFAASFPYPASSFASSASSSSSSSSLTQRDCCRRNETTLRKIQKQGGVV